MGSSKHPPDQKPKLLQTWDPESFLFQTVPKYLMEGLNKYFRLTVEGAEHLPRRGPCLITPNHSGFSGFDAMLLAHEVIKASHRRPRIMTHKYWFASSFTGTPAKRLGFIKASYYNGLKTLEDGQMLIIFPEGEWGNFKPTTKAYHLQRFRRGFVRMAIETRAPVIPTLVIGAEETHINLKRIQLKGSFKAVLPLPLNIIPLPVKWKIIFLEPIQWPYLPEAAHDNELLYDLATEVQDKMQEALNRELSQRTSIFR